MNSGIPMQLWVYRARPVYVIDGDTIDVYVDHGFHSLAVERFRLLGVDTPELRSSDLALREKAQLAKNYTTEWLAIALNDCPAKLLATKTGDWPLVVETAKSDSFGRFLATVWRESDGSCLNDDLIASGMAIFA